jgi:hypothetical protein
MQFKVKALIGLYQCVAAVPSIFNVVAPAGLDEYTMWMHIITLPSELTNVVIPGQCIAETYRTRLLIGSMWPLGFLFLSTLCFVLWQLAADRWSRDAAGTRRPVRLGLQNALPLTLVVTFLLVPSTAMQAFKTFLCDSIEYRPGKIHRFLHDDLTLSCDSDLYASTRRTAWVMIAIWPIGARPTANRTPALYRAAMSPGPPAAYGRDRFRCCTWYFFGRREMRSRSGTTQH